ncbi:hypothetical protein [Streptomyces platensis]|uniref:hypothetical protein n=1 Tax=Streptomyces platensis TaxID=58346 RepID=UPI00332AB193
MFQQGTVVQCVAVSEHWGAYGKVAGSFGDDESYTVNLLAPRTGTAVWGRRSVVRVWDSPAAEGRLPAIRPGGTLPIPGLRLPAPSPAPAGRRFLRRGRGRGRLAPGVQPLRRSCRPEAGGEGEHRAVILNPARTTVYKVETHRGRNRREHRTLSGLRRHGYGYAPPTTVWAVPGATRGTEVLAMPYLPDDGTTPCAPYPLAGVEIARLQRE